jgi:hypothetical protein
MFSSYPFIKPASLYIPSKTTNWNDSEQAGKLRLQALSAAFYTIIVEDCKTRCIGNCTSNLGMVIEATGK